ncbi:MAG: MerC domain-containing protein [Erythrobacter sp.]
MQSHSSFDRAATVLSLSCVAHCVALPIIAVSLPFLGSMAQAEWIHWALTAMAIAASGTVIVRAHGGRSPAFLVPVLFGITLISFAVFADSIGIDETPPTVIGGLLIAAAHIHRLIKHK